MGNYKFRLSDMMPNAWFFKLRDMNKLRNHINNKTTKEKQNSHSSSAISSSSSIANQRKSYYFTRDLHSNSPSKTTPFEKQDPPRKSSRKRRSTKRNRNPNRNSPRLLSSMVSAGCSCSTTLESVWTKLPEEYPDSPIFQASSSENDSMLPEFGCDRGMTSETFEGMLSWSTSCQCRIDNDIIIDINKKNPSLNVSLPPIITKKTEPTKIQRTSAEFAEKNASGSLSVKVIKEDFPDDKTATNSVRRSSSPGLKLRTNSPRIANRRIQGRKSVSSSSSGSRGSVSGSFAVVKSSKDPKRDFRESMVEMIVENNIRASKDLEELLACYLSLNSDEYHDLIINVFKQIWFDFIHLRFK